ncbi:MAG: hypothetical protein ACOVT5_16315 [Armatimonadaceae bacterium]|jgi:hypothetical protein
MPRTIKAFTLLESLLTLLIVSFVIAASGMLFSALMRQQQVVREVSKGDEILGDAFRTVVRVVRHGRMVVVDSPVFGSGASAADRLTVQVPEPDGTVPENVAIQFRVVDGVLLKRRADEASPGTALAPGAVDLQVVYYFRVGEERYVLPGTVGTKSFGIADATEVELTIDLDYGRQRFRQSTTVALRNRLATL